MSKEEKQICVTCGYIGQCRTITKGSFLIELGLWLLFILPGLIYSLWRLSSRYDACPICKNTPMIPIDTPKGRELALGKN